jgi:hypothetical protein
MPLFKSKISHPKSKIVPGRGIAAAPDGVNRVPEKHALQFKGQSGTLGNRLTQGLV